MKLFLCLCVILIGVLYGTDAFMEDVCIISGGAGYKNLYQSAFDLGCQVGQTTTACAQAATQAGLSPPTCCFGSVHMLGMYMIAQAFGLNSDLSYLMALFSSAVDPPQLTMCNWQGTALAARYQAPTMKGNMRLGMLTVHTLFSYLSSISLMLINALVYFFPFLKISAFNFN